MEFGEKLQELRKKKGITQEELSELLYVSRAAVSKWESGRGYPNIDSLKSIAKLFSVSIDELLSGEEILTIAEDDNKQKEKNLCNLVFGLLDCSIVMFLFLPFFAYEFDGVIHGASLLQLYHISLWIRIAFFVFTALIFLCGLLSLAFQNLNNVFWVKNRSGTSMVLSACGVLLFIISRQPYAAVFLFILLSIKGLLLAKK